MSVLLIAGSPSEHSRSAALLQAVSLRLQFRGATVDWLPIRDLSPQALILADFGHPTISAAMGRIAVPPMAPHLSHATFWLSSKLLLTLSLTSS